MQSVDTLIAARWIVPVEPAGVTLENHAVVIHLGRIIDVLSDAEAREKYSATHNIELGEHVLIPGLINLHSHAAMTLMRGLADDLGLMTWLNDHIWPAEGQHVSDAFVFDGSLLACAEMLRGGVTCFNDMYFFPEATARAARAAHMRAMVGIVVIEFPSPYATSADDYLAKGLAARDASRGDALVGFTMAPHAPYTVSDRSFERIAMLAGELDIPINIHLQETRDELMQSEAQFGVRPVERLRRLGLLGPSLIAVHAVHLADAEIELLAENGCHVAHCPVSNLKLASGIAPVAQMLKAGVNVGIGTDGAASNNRLDILSEMRMAALLAKGVSGDAAIVPAHQAIAMATLHSARALGLDGAIGSIVAGKRADLTAIDLSGLKSAPCYDPASHVAYVCGRDDVSHVWVDGEPVVHNGTLTRMDEQELLAKARLWKNRIKP